MLAALPKEVQERVMNFLVPFLPRQGHECPVIATGVASRNLRVNTIVGYRIWTPQAATYVDDFTAWINARTLRKLFNQWFLKHGYMLGRIWYRFATPWYPVEVHQYRIAHDVTRWYRYNA